MDRKDFESLLKKYPDCISDGKKLKSYIRDLYPDTPKAIMNTLMTMADDGIISQMQKNGQSTLLLTQFKKNLVDDYGLSEQIIEKCFEIVVGVESTDTSIATRDEYSNDSGQTPFVEQEYDSNIFEIENGVLLKYNWYDDDQRESVVIPHGISSIGEYAFSECEFTSIVIPNGVKTIGEGAFYYCTSLEKIEFPEGLESIEDGAFYGCESLKRVVLPQGITHIGRDAFRECSELKRAIIPNSVLAIEEYTFYDCTNLSVISIGDNVTYIGGYAFDNTEWYRRQPNGLLYIGNIAYQYKGTMPSNTTINIRENTRGIAGHAFADCKGLESIIIPDGVCNIGEVAFYGCEDLKKITIPNSVDYIGDDAFRGCDNLIIYCEREREPESWKGSTWNPDNRPVAWSLNKYI